ncbi:MAG: helix-turn-helix domain-containing protein [Candidatus Eisenbacteria bacterium]|nr:helix-turn-helix domain-containing protein [Candidatus Eisenbacteria bacterium]
MVPPPHPERYLLVARLGVLHARAGDAPAAESCFLGALELARAAGDPWQEAACVGHLTLLLLQAGRVEECARLHGEWTVHLAGEGADPAAAFRELGHGGPPHAEGGGALAGLSEAIAEPPLPARVAAAESALLRQTLEGVAWNQSRAARVLGISEQSVRYKMRKHGIQRPA